MIGMVAEYSVAEMAAVEPQPPQIDSTIVTIAEVAVGDV